MVNNGIFEIMNLVIGMLGEYIKYMRISRKMTQKELAKKLFIAPCTLSHYETGIRMVPYSLFEKCIKILDYKIKIIDCLNKQEISTREIERVLK